MTDEQLKEIEARANAAPPDDTPLTKEELTSKKLRDAFMRRTSSKQEVATSYTVLDTNTPTLIDAHCDKKKKYAAHPQQKITPHQ